MTSATTLKGDERLIDDGFGQFWEKCERTDCCLEIVRPGRVQCTDQKCFLNDHTWKEPPK